MKLQYVGDSFRDGLTDGKFYEGKAINMFCIALIEKTEPTMTAVWTMISFTVFEMKRKRKAESKKSILLF